ncbi:aconitase family protein [Pseudomonas congelans]|uniref:aconitase family protein n=1 Tax=Pseudomonas congelans TaxID=200452 RepID=UPI001EFF0D55|nr:aconitase family protein [Pseudomonas congelans]
MRVSGLVDAFARAQGLWHDSFGAAEYDRVVTLDLSSVARSIAGPKQPHQRIVLGRRAPATNLPAGLDNGSVVLAAIRNSDEVRPTLIQHVELVVGQVILASNVLYDTFVDVVEQLI